METRQAYRQIMDAVSVTPEVERRELADSLSYPLLLPAEVPDGYALDSIRCLQGQLAEVVWQGAGGQSLTYRMAPGAEDVSGDFTAYGWEDTLTAGAYTVTCKGGTRWCSWPCGATGPTASPSTPPPP